MVAEFLLKNAMAATACLIHHLSLMQDDDYMGSFELLAQDHGRFMRLDASAVKALNLVPGPNDGG
jgi:DNA mismatch repair protein MSH2